MLTNDSLLPWLIPLGGWICHGVATMGQLELGVPVSDLKAAKSYVVTSRYDLWAYLSILGVVLSLLTLYT